MCVGQESEKNQGLQERVQQGLKNEGGTIRIKLFHSGSDKEADPRFRLSEARCETV
jgi:hypothetical protein